MKATLKDGMLTISIEFDPTGTPSKTGKTKVHASTHGNIQTKVEGLEKEVFVGINVYSK